MTLNYRIATHIT